MSKEYDMVVELERIKTQVRELEKSIDVFEGHYLNRVDKDDKRKRK